MLLHAGRPPQSNGPTAAAHGGAAHAAAARSTPASAASSPSPAGVHMLLLSIFDGHGGAETSHYCHQHFHPFLRARIEARWRRWTDERKEWAAQRDEKDAAAAAATATADTSVAHAAAAVPVPRRKRTGSFTESGDPKEAAAAAAAPSRSRSHSASHGGGASTVPLAPPAYPFDAAFLTAAFLDFDASIPLPSPDNIPRNQPPPPQQHIGGMRRQTQQAPPEGNNIPHLASGTTATLCIVDLANQ